MQLTLLNVFCFSFKQKIDATNVIVNIVIQIIIAQIYDNLFV